MKATYIQSIYRNPEQFADQTIKVSGWVRTLRASKAFGFIELNDGTFFKNLQIVFEESGALYTCGVDYIELGKLSGNMANKVLAGEDISKMSIKIADNPEIVINKKVLENLNLEIDKSIEDSVTWIGGN